MKLTARRQGDGFVGWGSGYLGSRFTVDLVETLEEVQVELERRWRESQNETDD